MIEFKREERYIVIKLKDVGEVGLIGLRNYLKHAGIPTRECVVVEPHHPHYEETWENVRRWAEGRPTLGEELASMLGQSEANLRAHRQSVKNLTADCDALARERDALARERDALARERDALARERDALEASNVNISRQHGELQEALVETRERERALVAHVEMIEAHAKHCGWDDPETSILAMILDRGPATSLARRDLLKQAEALDELADKETGLIDHRSVRSRARELRRQAEGGD